MDDNQKTSAEKREFDTMQRLADKLAFLDAPLNIKVAKKAFPEQHKKGKREVEGTRDKGWAGGKSSAAKIHMDVEYYSDDEAERLRTKDAKVLAKKERSRRKKEKKLDKMVNHLNEHGPG